MDIVWQRRGMMVSPNTYYQNISILRKGLKKAGFETDPIVTIPRIGLTLASDTQITIKEAQLPLAEPEAPVQTVQEEAGVPQPVASVTPVAPVAKRRFWLVGALLALLLIVSVSVISYSRPHDSYFCGRLPLHDNDGRVSALFCPRYRDAAGQGKSAGLCCAI
ncbi:putative transcriptional regulatory protein [Enterobacter cloacae]|uniref:Putative transcriptional regulatory protein n=1 Tax=Enterobacter cloacae TaxID=550 RepID=A0A377LNR5_ENTCL|nr:putative transcriptional regulatory protein [Enterobacter cloacae]